jgi:hypothetical protein
MFRLMMIIIGRRPALQRKYFTCITCMCGLVRVRNLVFKIYFCAILCESLILKYIIKPLVFLLIFRNFTYI